MTTGGQLSQAHTVVCRKESKEQHRHKLHLCALKTKDLTFGLSSTLDFLYNVLLCLKKIQTEQKLDERSCNPRPVPTCLCTTNTYYISNMNMDSSAKKIQTAFIFFETGTCYVAMLDFVMIFLLLPPQCWDYRCAPPHTVRRHFLKNINSLLGRHINYII